MLALVALLLGAAGADASCLARFAEVGVPRHVSPAAEAVQFHPAICRRGYALSFNRKTRNPDWVIERLDPSSLSGKGSRSNRFRPDPLLGPLSPTPDDFRNSGYDRGHQAPAADSKFDQQAMDESFYMSNMSPQVGIGFNRGEWSYLEDQVRRWVGCGHGDVIVITGPVYGTSGRTIGSPPIAVPDAFYKIVYDPRAHQAVGFELPNRKMARTAFAAFAVPIRRIEVETGLNFFAALDLTAQENLEARAAAPWPDEAGCGSPKRSRRRPAVSPHPAAASQPAPATGRSLIPLRPSPSKGRGRPSSNAQLSPSPLEGGG